MTKAQQNDARHKGRKRNTFTEEDNGKPLTEELLRWWIGRKPKKVRNIWDGDGLFIRITPRGKMSWKLEYTVRNAPDPSENKRGKMTLGPYTQKHSLEWARVEARRNLDLANDGINPYKAQKEEKNQLENKNKTFKEVSELWFEDQIKHSTNTEKTKRNLRSRLENHLYSLIGNTHYSDITSEVLYNIIRRKYIGEGVEKKKDVENNRKTVLTKKLIADLFRIGKWAKRKQYSDINPAEDLAERCMWMKVEMTSHAAITDPIKIGEYLKKLYEIKPQDGSDTVKNAVIFITYIPLRSAELRGAKIKELDFDSNTLTIPKDRMKTRNDFIVPLTSKAVEILRRQIQSNLNKGKDDYIFQRNGKPIGINSMTRFLHSMGYGSANDEDKDKDKATIHGLRATFSTLMRASRLSEEEIIEKNLSHSYGNKVVQAYNRGSYIEQRRQCFEDYGHLLDGLKEDRDFDDIVNEIKRRHQEEYMNKQNDLNTTKS